MQRHNASGWRRRGRAVAHVVGSVLMLTALSACVSPGSSTAPAPDDAAKAAAVMRIVDKGMADYHLRSAIVRVTIDGRDIVTAARGESLTGFPATTDMHFRNGAVAISYVSTLLLVLADETEKVVSLDDKVSKWLPQLPHADEVTLEQLATMTSGYQDYVPDPAFGAAIYADPFRQWTPEELLAYVVDKPLWYVPGKNWNYAHTNYVILGLALEKATGRPINDLLQEKVLGPLGLTNTIDPGNASIAAPVLHAYSSERRFALGIPAGDPFYEETTF